MAKKKTHKRSWKWENMKLNMRKVPFERKWIVRLNRPNSSSVTQGSIMQLTQTKPSKASRWVYATATTSALVSESCRAARTPLLASGASCALLTVRSPCTPVSTAQNSSLPFTSCLPCSHLYYHLRWKQDSGGHVLHTPDLWTRQQA